MGRRGSRCAPQSITTYVLPPPAAPMTSVSLPRASAGGQSQSPPRLESPDARHWAVGGRSVSCGVRAIGACPDRARRAAAPSRDPAVGEVPHDLARLALWKRRLATAPRSRAMILSTSPRGPARVAPGSGRRSRARPPGAARAAPPLTGSPTRRRSGGAAPGRSLWRRRRERDEPGRIGASGVSNRGWFTSSRLRPAADVCRRRQYHVAAVGADVEPGADLACATPNRGPMGERSRDGVRRRR